MRSPVPVPEPEPVPARSPEPAPIPAPIPAPVLAPVPVPEPEPVPARSPAPALLLALLAACTPSPSSPAAPSSPDSLLLGGETCRTGAECATGSCSLGMCAGYLMGSTELAREVMAPAVRAAASDPAVAAGLRALAGEVLADLDNDRFVRARAAEALSLLPAGSALPAVAPFLDDPEEPVRFFVARALHRAGDARGTVVLRGFLDHPSRAVRAMAEEAINR